MGKRIFMAGALLVSLSIIPADGSPAADAQKDDNKGKGMTVEDLARGLKSAAKNIENEIPKIGPAIGDTFKKATGKGPSKPSDDKTDKPSK